METQRSTRKIQSGQGGLRLFLVGKRQALQQCHSPFGIMIFYGNSTDKQMLIGVRGGDNFQLPTNIFLSPLAKFRKNAAVACREISWSPSGFVFRQDPQTTTQN
jgi:hypothetical protein